MIADSIILDTTAEVTKKIDEIVKNHRPDKIYAGIDTLTCWSSEESGWRAADRTL